MKFNIKDLNYMGIILALITLIFVLNLEHQREYEWCEYYYDKFGG
jgi:hypothetical protein|tara:strand:+ start:761 stop:895 length:135 start_codon:yes stop_codon:yes gene_type:complete